MMNTGKLMERNYHTLYSNDWCEVREAFYDLQKSLISIVSFKKGETIARFKAKTILRQPNYLTLQVDMNTHILLQPEYLQYINHSCNPNSFFDTDTMQLVALEDICLGTELTFFYPSTEWKMQQSFNCLCKSKDCMGSIQGAYYLGEDVKKRYKFTGFINQMFEMYGQ